MVGVLDCGEKFGVAEGAADIFGWAGILPADAANRGRRFRLDVLVLDQHHVMPVIPEVINVVKAARVYAEGLVQQDASLIDVLEFVLKIRIRFAVPNAADDELVQMAVRPTEGGLKDLMQPEQLDGFRHDDAAPNRWSHIEEFDPATRNLKR